MALSTTGWTITPDAFESLLSSFDEDRDRAGQKYEILRCKLLEFFAARGSRAPDEHADETLNRVARKIADGEAVENINKYYYGVAKFLWMEVVRRQTKEPVASRDINDENTLEIFRTTRKVRVRLVVKNDVYRRFSAAVTTIEGATIWQKKGLKANPDNGRKSVALQFPPALLTKQDYIVTLKGTIAKGQTETVGEYYFRAERSPK